LLDGRNGQTARANQRQRAAAECMVADALTKSLCTAPGSCGFAARYRADALLLEPMAPIMMFHSPCDTATGLDSLEALAEIFSLLVLALLFLSGVAWTYWNYLAAPGDLETSAKAWTMKIHGPRDGSFSAHRHAPKWAREIRMRARRNRANGSVFLSAFPS